MTERSLKPSQRRILEIVDELPFGRIEGLTVRLGEPYYEPSPRIVQEIKLGSEAEPRPRTSDRDFALKKEFESLFSHLEQLANGTVDIEIRHGVPFRLIIHDPGMAGARRPREVRQ